MSDPTRPPLHIIRVSHKHLTRCDDCGRHVSLEGEARETLRRADIAAQACPFCGAALARGRDEARPVAVAARGLGRRSSRLTAGLLAATAALAGCPEEEPVDPGVGGAQQAGAQQAGAQQAGAQQAGAQQAGAQQAGAQQAGVMQTPDMDIAMPEYGVFPQPDMDPAIPPYGVFPDDQGVAPAPDMSPGVEAYGVFPASDAEPPAGGAQGGAGNGG